MCHSLTVKSVASHSVSQSIGKSVASHCVTDGQVNGKSQCVTVQWQVTVCHSLTGKSAASYIVSQSIGKLLCDWRASQWHVTVCHSLTGKSVARHIVCQTWHWLASVTCQSLAWDLPIAPLHTTHNYPLHTTTMCESLYRVLQCVAVCCSVLQCVAVWCSVLQCDAVCCSVLL